MFSVCKLRRFLYREPHISQVSPLRPTENGSFSSSGEGRPIVACEVGAWYGETEPCTMDDRLALGLLIK